LGMTGLGRPIRWAKRLVLAGKRLMPLPKPAGQPEKNQHDRQRALTLGRRS
jgi:hypothetical protein